MLLFENRQRQAGNSQSRSKRPSIIRHCESVRTRVDTERLFLHRGTKYRLTATGGLRFPDHDLQIRSSPASKGPATQGQPVDHFHPVTGNNRSNKTP